MDRGAWQATVHGVTESDMTKRLSKAQQDYSLHSFSNALMPCPQFHWSIKLTRATPSAFPIFSLLSGLWSSSLGCYEWGIQRLPQNSAPTQGASGEQNAFSDCSLPPIRIVGGRREGISFWEFVNNRKLVFKWFLFSLGLLASFFPFGTEIKAETSESLISPNDSSFAFQNWSTCGITSLPHPGQQAPITLAPGIGFMKDSFSIDPGQEGVF